jgi:hypothetical protein
VKNVRPKWPRIFHARAGTQRFSRHEFYCCSARKKNMVPRGILLAFLAFHLSALDAFIYKVSRRRLEPFFRCRNLHSKQIFRNSQANKENLTECVAVNLSGREQNFTCCASEIILSLSLSLSCPPLSRFKSFAERENGWDTS